MSEDLIWSLTVTQIHAHGGHRDRSRVELKRFATKDEADKFVAEHVEPEGRLSWDIECLQPWKIWKDGQFGTNTPGTLMHHGFMCRVCGIPMPADKVCWINKDPGGPYCYDCIQGLRKEAEKEQPL